VPRRSLSLLVTAIVMISAVFATPALASGPTASATKVKAQAAQAAKSCKKATARAAKASSPAKAKKLRKAKKKACNKAKALAAKARSVTPKAAAAATAAAPSATYKTDAPGSGFVVGVDANTKVYANPGAQMDKIAQADVGNLREEIEWDRIEPTKGNYDWSLYDRVYSDAAKHNMRIMGTITSPPSWAAPSWNWIPDDPTQYAGFVAKVAARYGAGGSFWTSHPSLPNVATTHFELWNEPYVDNFAANGMDAARYANLAIAAADAGHAANPATKYLASTDDTDADAEDWTRKMFAARPDLAQHIDAIAIHPYGPDLDTYNEGPAGSFRRNLEQTQTALVENGAGDMPIWITELGWSTCNSGGVCISEQRQAELTRQLGQLLETDYSSSVRGLFVFNYSDYGNNPSNSENNYGFVHNDGTAKPALAELRSIADSQS
jgi:hypothetical protein